MLKLSDRVVLNWTDPLMGARASRFKVEPLVGPLCVPYQRERQAAWNVQNWNPVPSGVEVGNFQTLCPQGCVGLTASTKFWQCAFPHKHVTRVDSSAMYLTRVPVRNKVGQPLPRKLHWAPLKAKIMKTWKPKKKFHAVFTRTLK